jgi:hypothetical protein
MNIKGTVKQVMDTQVISEKFSKRDLILIDNSNEKYPQYLTIQFVQDRVSLLDGLSPGDEIDVSINLRGREYTKDGVTKYFNTTEGWRIESAGSGSGAPQASVGVDSNGNSNDDLPF